jgi:hypothetical protein
MLLSCQFLSNLAVLLLKVIETQNSIVKYGYELPQFSIQGSL